jgi:pyruvate,water dikinase
MLSADDESLVLAMDSPAATVDRAGGKGASLARLAAAGLPVPPGFHLTTSMYRRFVDENHLGELMLAEASEAQAAEPSTLDRASARISARMMQGTIPADIAMLIRSSYDRLGQDDPRVAVRSSATAEDLPDMSFAGQQDTYLNVRGADAVLEAVRLCWTSLWTARALGYRARQGIRSEDVAIAVVVQQLVPADVSGILFTAHPLTGARDRMVINAAWGLGEAIVGGHVTPDVFVVDKDTCEVESQTIADKEVMTVRLPTGTGEERVAAGQRRRATLRSQDAAQLAQLGVKIERLYRQPMDVEWAKAGDRFFILQARPITALPDPPATLDWTLPDARARYMRSSVIELLPEPLSLLFATLALPAWNTAMRDLMTLLAPGLVLPPPRMTLLTINDYVYYDVGLTTWQSMRMVAAMLIRIRMVLALCLGAAQSRWADQARPHYAKVAADWGTRDMQAMPASALVKASREIVRAAADHYLTIQSGILPAAFTSEALFTLAYNRLAKRTGDPPAVTFMLGFDSAPMQAEKSLFDLAAWARDQPDLADYLTRSTSGEVVARYILAPSRASASGDDRWREFCRLLTGHLDRFGHAVYDLDFAKGLPTEDPAPLIEAIKHFLTTQARNPYERQAAAAAAREQAAQSLLSRLHGPRGWLFRWLLPWAQRYAPLREDALADVGLGWPVVRRSLLELGRRLVAAASIRERDDVFWLTLEEAEAAAQALDAGQAVTGFGQVVIERRAAWERERAVTPPVSLPIKGGMRFLGIDFSATAPARTDQAAGHIIKGHSASPGRVNGIACVIRGPGEFALMRAGDILVAKITTPAWTPLFALAAGVVTDVGGPLSHGSIVAREYHIPAVLGTGVATERIHTADRLTVDGDRGLVTIG